MGLTKAQLDALNDSSFPNNNGGLITPLVLRDYNDATIVNTVNQDVYTADSASFNTRILAVTGSSINTGSFATTGSNSFNGDQNVTGSIRYSGQLQIGSLSTGPTIQALDSGTPAGNTSLQVNAGTSGSFSLRTLNGAGVGKALLEAYDTFPSFTTFAKFEANSNGSVKIEGSSQVSISGSSTTIQDVDFIPFSASLNTRILAVTGSSIDTGSFATTGSNTFVGNQTISQSVGTTSLSLSGGEVVLNLTGSNSYIKQTGVLWFRNQSGASGFRETNFVTRNNSINFGADNGFYFGRTDGGDGVNTSGGIKLNTISGSLVLTPSSFSVTTGSLSHISASSNTTLVNLIFKNNSNTGTTIISGSGNIFTNPATPTTGYIRYIGGANNIYLNSSNGVTSQITASAISVSGVRPVMNNNIFQGTANFTIDQAVNGGTHTYSNNLVAAANNLTINALAFTGSGFTISDNLFKGGAVTINVASASLAEIATGLSGSAGTGIGIDRNIMTGTGTMNITVGQKVTSGFTNIFGNIGNAGALTIINISSSVQVSALSNNVNQAQTYSNAGAAGLALHRTAGQMTNNFGGMNLIASASAINATFTIGTTAMVVTNRSYSGSLGSGSLTLANNLNAGTGHNYTVSGSFAGTVANITGVFMAGNSTIGNSNTIFTNVEGRENYVDFRSNLTAGQSLILTGSNNSAITASGGGYFGRFNADDGIRNQTAENIFFVGTGTSASNRKTGFLIDSGSNIYAEGSFNVSGSTAFTGSLKVASTFQLQLPTGSNQQAGTAVLDGASPSLIVVSNSLVSANSIIIVSKQTLTNAHSVAVSSKGAGTFTISSSGNGDTDTVGWFVINNS